MPTIADFQGWFATSNNTTTTMLGEFFVAAACTAFMLLLNCSNIPTPALHWLEEPTCTPSRLSCQRTVNPPFDARTVFKCQAPTTKCKCSNMNTRTAQLTTNSWPTCKDGNRPTVDGNIMSILHHIKTANNDGNQPTALRHLASKFHNCNHWQQHLIRSTYSTNWFCTCNNNNQQQPSSS